MAVVVRCCEWLLAISKGDEKKLEDLTQQSTTSGTEDGSRDGAALARAGPCCGFQELQPLSNFASKGMLFRSCASQEELKDLQESFAPARKLYQTLVASCKASVTELRAARQRAAAAEEAAKKRNAKEADAALPKKKAKGRKANSEPGAAAAGAQQQHAVFKLESQCCVSISSNSWEEDFGRGKACPFVISGVHEISEGAADQRQIKTALNDFNKAFKESSLKACVWGIVAL